VWQKLVNQKGTPIQWNWGGIEKEPGRGERGILSGLARGRGTINEKNLKTQTTKEGKRESHCEVFVKDCRGGRTDDGTSRKRGNAKVKTLGETG